MGNKISLRLDEKFEKDIDQSAESLDMNRSEYIRNCVRGVVYGDKFSEFHDEEEKSYELSIETDDIAVNLQGDGFSSQKEMEEDRKHLIEESKEYVKFLMDLQSKAEE